LLHNASDAPHDRLSSRKGDIIAEAIIQFYIDLFKAETRAFKKVYTIFK